jgi:dienelactone hydrolase
VKHWNSKGYAAIAMDLEGHLPGGGHFGVQGGHPSNQPHPNAGPSRVGWAGDIALPDTEQWFYHAVADVIRGNSLLRSFPEINKDKIGLTGISWGGTVASAVAGVDSRFAFVIPVYGGGYIHKHEMTPDQYKEYLAKWDPSAHLPYAKMPMLWVNGAGEPVFPLDGFSRSAALTQRKSILCIRGFLPHGHGFGWDEVWEIGGFANGVVTGKAPMPNFDMPYVDPKDGLVHAKYRGPIRNAAIAFTNKQGKWGKNGALPTIPCRLANDEVIATKALPAGTTAYRVDANGDGAWRDASVDTPLVWLKK